jgi:hypothetical protein
MHAGLVVLMLMLRLLALLMLMLQLRLLLVLQKRDGRGPERADGVARGDAADHAAGGHARLAAPGGRLTHVVRCAALCSSTWACGWPQHASLSVQAVRASEREVQEILRTRAREEQAISLEVGGAAGAAAPSH